MRRTPAVIALAALAASAAVAVAPVSAGAAPAAPAPAGTSAAGRQVTLVTGDVVTVSTSGGRTETSVAKHAASGPGAQFETFTLGSHVYVVPVSATPYLGTTLDLSLFDVSQPAPTVELTYRSASAPSAVPGLRVTHRSGTQGQAVVTRSGAFSTALARQWQADHSSATHTTGLFANVARIAPAVLPSTPQPDYPMYTLTLKGIDATGQADTGDGALLFNVDDLRRYGGFPTFVNGVAKVSVPGGHYAALADFYDFASNIVYQVMTPQFTVNGTSSLTLDARAATSAVTIATPQPAAAAINELGTGRGDARGQVSSFSFLGDGSTAYRVQPTRPVSIGQVYFYVYSRQFAADDSYSYDLKFPTDGVIPADNHYVARAADLATVASAYPAAHPDTQSLDARFAALPWQFFLFASDVQFSTPVQRTEYYTALPNLYWQGLDNTVFKPDTFDFLGALQSTWRVYRPGVRTSTTWGGSPAGPRLETGPIFTDETVCPACIRGDRVYLLGYPFSDNAPDHFGFPDGPAGGLHETLDYTLYGDDVPVQHGNFLDASARLPAGTQTMRLDYDTTRSSTDFTLSTDVRTSWTEPMTVPTSALPTGWVCSADVDVPACQVLPLITASYQLPVDLLGALSPGAATAHLALGHVDGGSLAFRTVQVRVSYDGGQSWQPATVRSQGNGGYAVGLTVPTNTDGYGALQVSARDAAGGTFQQTIQHAFAVSAS